MDLQVVSDFSPKDSGILVPVEIDVWTNQYPNAPMVIYGLFTYKIG